MTSACGAWMVSPNRKSIKKTYIETILVSETCVMNVLNVMNVMNDEARPRGSPWRRSKWMQWDSGTKPTTI